MAQGNFLTGYAPKNTQLPLYNPQQQQGFSQILQQALGQLQNNRPNFGAIRQNAERGFQQNTVPSILNRLSSMGTRGSLESSYTGNALGGAASDLQSNLAGLESQYDLQSQGQLQNLLSMGLAPQFENIYQPETSGLLGGAAPGVGQGLGQLLGASAQSLPWGQIGSAALPALGALGPIGGAIGGLGGLAALIYYLSRSNRSAGRQ